MASASAAPGGRRGGRKRPAFAPVIVEAASPSPDVPLAPARPDGPVIEIVIGAATVRIPPGIDAATLMTVLRAVKAAT